VFFPPNPGNPLDLLSLPPISECLLTSQASRILSSRRGPSAPVHLFWIFPLLCRPNSNTLPPVPPQLHVLTLEASIRGCSPPPLITPHLPPETRRLDGNHLTPPRLVWGMCILRRGASSPTLVSLTWSSGSLLYFRSFSFP